MILAEILGTKAFTGVERSCGLRFYLRVVRFPGVSCLRGPKTDMKDPSSAFHLEKGVGLN